MNLVRDNRNRRLMSPFFSFPSIFDDEDLADFGTTSGMNLWEDENKIYVEVAIPGMKEKDVDVTLENGVLTIRAAREEIEEKKEKAKKVYSSSMKTNYYYSTSLPSSAGQDVSAALEDGVLNIEIPKAEESKPKKIEVTRR